MVAILFVEIEITSPLKERNDSQMYLPLIERTIKAFYRLAQDRPDLQMAVNPAPHEYKLMGIIPKSSISKSSKHHVPAPSTLLSLSSDSAHISSGSSVFHSPCEDMARLYLTYLYYLQALFPHRVQVKIQGYGLPESLQSMVNEQKSIVQGLIEHRLRNALQKATADCVSKDPMAITFGAKTVTIDQPTSTIHFDPSPVITSLALSPFLSFQDTDNILCPPTPQCLQRMHSSLTPTSTLYPLVSSLLSPALASQTQMTNAQCQSILKSQYSYVLALPPSKQFDYLLHCRDLPKVQSILQSLHQHRPPLPRSLTPLHLFSTLFTRSVQRYYIEDELSDYLLHSYLHQTTLLSLIPVYLPSPLPSMLAILVSRSILSLCTHTLTHHLDNIDSLFIPPIDAIHHGYTDNGKRDLLLRLEDIIRIEVAGGKRDIPMQELLGRSKVCNGLRRLHQYLLKGTIPCI